MSVTQKPTIISGIAKAIDVPIRVIDTPGYGDVDGNDQHFTSYNP